MAKIIERCPSSVGGVLLRLSGYTPSPSESPFCTTWYTVTVYPMLINSYATSLGYNRVNWIECTNNRGNHWDKWIDGTRRTNNRWLRQLWQYVGVLVSAKYPAHGVSGALSPARTLTFIMWRVIKAETLMGIFPRRVIKYLRMNKNRRSIIF